MLSYNCVYIFYTIRKRRFERKKDQRFKKSEYNDERISDGKFGDFFYFRSKLGKQINTLNQKNYGVFGTYNG